MSNHLRRVRASRQALAVLVVGILLGGAAIGVARKPADADQLRIHIATLRSQAAELAELRALERGDALPTLFVRMHAQQLRQAVDRERDALRQLSIDQPRLLVLREQAQHVSDRLAGAVDATLRAPATAAHAAQALARELQALEQALAAG